MPSIARNLPEEFHLPGPELGDPGTGQRRGHGTRIVTANVIYFRPYF